MKKSSAISRVVALISAWSILASIGGIPSAIFAAADYDLSRDFSTSTNPNGAWTYGYKNTLSGDVVPFGLFTQGADQGGALQDIWLRTFGTPSAIFHNGSSVTGSSDGGAGTFPPGTVFLVPGYEGNVDNFGAIRFIAPASGDYSVNCDVRSYLDAPPGGDADFHVVKNGTELFGIFLPNFGSSGYTNTLSVASGDSLDFLVGRGADGHLYGSGLKIKLTISPVGTNQNPPVIVTQPHNATGLLGGDVTFSVVAIGAEPLNYQWRFGEDEIDGANTASLTVTNVQSASQGPYSVKVFNAFGTNYSSNAVLTITDPSVIVPPSSVSLAGGGGTDILRSVMRLQDCYGASMFPTQAIVIHEIRLRPHAGVGQAFSATASNLKITFSTSTAQPESLSPTFANNIGPDSTIVFQGSINLSSSFTGPAGGPKDFDIIIPLTTPFPYDSRNGNLLVEFLNSAQSSVTYVDSGGLLNDQAGRAFGYGLNPSQASTVDYACDVLQLVYSLPSGPPVILVQPKDTIVTEGGDADFAVFANGAAPLSYQWSHNGEDLPGATNSTLSIHNVQNTDAGTYGVQVANSAGTNISANAMLTVTPRATYDLSRDFAPLNPNGVWAYGYKQSLGGAFVPYGIFTQATDQGGALQDIWLRTLGTPSAIFHNGSSIIGSSENGAGTYPPGTVMFFPGLEGNVDNYGAIRFTLPPGNAGSYAILSSVRPYLDAPPSGDSDYHVIKNGVEVFGVFLPPTGSSGYTNTLSLAEGDTLDFLVGRGQDNHLYASGLKIQIGITHLGVD